MSLNPFEDFGSDEHRAIEAIAALIDLTPRMPGETDESVVRRMTEWGLLQGPRVRPHALYAAVVAMVKESVHSPGFMELTKIGIQALKGYNRDHGEQ